MGLFKGFKDLKATVAAAPAMIDEAQAMQRNAQAMQVGMQHQLAMAAEAQQQAMASLQTRPGEGDFDAIAGVSLELYAEISKGLADHGYDQSKAVEVAASKGVSADAWQLALDGWNLRMRANRAVAQEFNRLYMGR